MNNEWYKTYLEVTFQKIQKKKIRKSPQVIPQKSYTKFLLGTHQVFIHLTILWTQF